MTFGTDEGRFNYRACAVVVREDRLLVMRDWHCPYYYLPGGKVMLGETAEEAVLRELREEMQVKATIVRPLWLCQAFFTEDVGGERFHELCLYYLVDIPAGELPSSGDVFATTERGRRNTFEWLPFEQLEDAYLYPAFVKTAAAHLPGHLEVIVERA